MKLTQKERADRKAAFREMGLKDKADYLYEYFKLPIILGIVSLALLVSFVYRQITKKEAILYAAHINVSVGDDLLSQLGGGFLSAGGYNVKKTEVSLFQGLYLSDDPTPENHEYQYASKLKIMAMIEAKQLDIVLMNREAYDIFSQNGYLLDFYSLLSPDDSLFHLLELHLTKNTVILEDNAIEYTLNEAPRYEAVTEEVTNGLDVSMFPMFQEAGFSDSVYLGVVANSPRFPAVMEYIKYLATGENSEGFPS